MLSRSVQKRCMSSATDCVACAGQLSRLPMMYEVNIFLTNRTVPIPEVLPRERLLVDNAGVSGFYHVIARSATQTLTSTQT